MHSGTMRRREMLRLLGLAAAAGLGAFAVRGCDRERAYVVDRRGQRDHPRRFVPVEVPPDRLVRSTVGLRPFRNTGFRLDTERLDGKQLIHRHRAHDRGRGGLQDDPVGTPGRVRGDAVGATRPDRAGMRRSDDRVAIGCSHATWPAGVLAAVARQRAGRASQSSTTPAMPVTSAATVNAVADPNPCQSAPNSSAPGSTSRPPKR